MKIKIQRYDPDKDEKPYMVTYEVDPQRVEGVMLLDMLEYIKTYIDGSLAFRRSCGGGVCGSDGMNINGKNGLACQTQLKDLPKNVTLYPFPSMPIIRDLIVDMSEFYRHYESARPYLKPKGTHQKEQIQLPEDRKKLDGLYECIMCGACTTACPSSWWNPDRFMGPQALLTVARFVFDSRDGDKKNRLKMFDDRYRLYRCRGVFNCVSVCPKGLNPAKAISDLRKEHAESS